MPTNADDLELYMLELINAERTSRGLDPLLLETNLNQSAEDHSEWMLEADVFSHTGENGSSATQRITEEFDLSGSWRTAENIAVQSTRGEEGYFDDVEDLHTSLMNSDGHRANLLNPDLEYIGLGIELGDFEFSGGREFASIIVTQNFATTSGTVDLDLGTSDPIEEPQEPEESQERQEPQIAELLVNGSFEAVQIDRSWAAVTDDDVAGWQSLNGERLEFWSSGQIRGVVSSDGSVHSEIDYGRSDTIDGIFQDIDTIDGETYTLSFDLRSRSNNAQSDSETLFVEWNGMLIEAEGFNASESREWETFIIEIEGTGDTDRLVFRESDVDGASDGRGPLLDNVSLVGPIDDMMF